VIPVVGFESFKKFTIYISSFYCFLKLKECWSVSEVFENYYIVSLGLMNWRLAAGDGWSFI
jgi:hypothetical protein